MRIAFVLPAPVRVPSGGAAVVYRHAEGLARRGHRVAVVCPRGLGRGGRLRDAALRAWNAAQGVADRPAYAAEGIETLEPDGLADLDRYDAVIATGIQTVRPVLKAVHRKTPDAREAATAETPVGEGVAVVHFVQGDETFVDPEARRAWTLPVARVAVSAWLADAVRAEGGRVLGIVPNAVDPFFLEPDADARPRGARVAALYHRHPVKGPDVLVATLEALRASRPDLEADVFAARRPSHRLPPWVRVHVRPSREALRSIYRRASVFLQTSRREGWALTPMEAAASGCAVAATASLGVAEFLRPGVSMRQVPVGDARALAGEALALLADAALCARTAAAGRADVARFSWDASTAEFERLLHLAAGRPATGP